MNPYVTLTLSLLALGCPALADNLPALPQQPELKPLEQAIDQAQQSRLQGERTADVPISWENDLPPAPCYQARQILVRESWQGQAQERPPVAISLDASCTPQATIFNILQQQIRARQQDGRIISSAKLAPADGQKMHEAAHITLHLQLLSLEAIAWPGSKQDPQRYGWNLALNEPINMRELDAIIETWTRLGRNQAHLDIYPNAQQTQASLVLRNPQRKPWNLNLASYWGEIPRREVNLGLEDLFALGEKLNLGLNRQKLSQGHSQTISPSIELPYGPIRLAGRARWSQTSRQLSMDTQTLALSQDEREISLGINWPLSRNATSIWRAQSHLRSSDQDSRLQDQALRSQSPKLRVFELGSQWQGSLAGGGMLLLEANFKRGLNRLGASSDAALQANQKSAAHAQFHSLHLQGILLKPLPAGRSLLAVAQHFRAPMGLYPSESFAMASSYGVEGIRQQNTQVDRGYSLRLGVNDLYRWRTDDGLHWQINGALACAKGQRHIDQYASRIHGGVVELAAQSRHISSQLRYLIPAKGHGPNPERRRLEGLLSVLF